MKPIYNVTLRYGLIGAVLAIVLLVVLFYADRHPFLIPTFFDFRILLFALFMFFALKEYKEYYNNSLLQFWQGMVISIGIYVLIGLVAGIFVTLFAAIEPDFMQGYIDGTIRGMELDKDRLVTDGPISLTEEQYQEQIALLKQTKPYLLGIDYFIKSCLIGFFIAIIISVILRKSEKRFTK